ncbi:MAG TPA: AAA family ATPase [Blastocatellia bacterium]|nr:AAA family ATPase [Blastocatellia bacterium]
MTVSKTERRAELQQWLRMVESLRDCPDWDQGELPIEMIRTHISVVLLGKRHVLKLKKPVDLGFLDYTTLEKRRDACQAEVELNSRLCAGYYEGVQPISRIDGKLRFSDRGPVVEYGVMMKRLPTEQMLDHLLARGEVTEAIIERVADRLSEFHRAARRGPEVDAFGSPDLIAGNWQENFDQTAPYIDRTIAAETYKSIRVWVTRWLGEHQELFRTRVREGHIRDGHGDIRAESICVTDGLYIFDCIEFNERFRFSDVASEVAFLAMDLDARGRPDLGYFFSEQYDFRCADPDLFKLLPFYRCYRAYIRGKVQSFRLDETELTFLEREVAALRARRYFDLAARYASPLRSPSVIAVTGLPGSGKTSIARAIAGELGLRFLSSDAVRKTLFEIKGRHEYGMGPYGAEANRLTYQTLVERGRGLLAQHRGVVLDATFRRNADRALSREMALNAGAQWIVIECRLPPEVVRERLERRVALGEGLSDAAWETYVRQRSEFEPFEDRDSPRLDLDTSADLAVVAHRATDWLRGTESPSASVLRSKLSFR